MKIGFLYICTGPYIEFFEEFYNSSKKYFLTDCNKHYFVFTDGENDLFENKDITVISQHQLEWPYAVLYKFHYFLQAQHLFKEMDYLIMTNSNMQFINQINKEEIIPQKEDNYLFGTIAPWDYKEGTYNLNINNFPDDDNSKAFVKLEDRKTYYAAGFCGGRKQEFLNMCYELRKWIEQDLAMNIFAKWEDQAYLNKYFSYIIPKKLTPSYCYPEEYEIPFEKKILVIYKQARKNDPLKKTYRKYAWNKKTVPPKNIFQKIRKYGIYYTIKFLKRFE